MEVFVTVLHLVVAFILISLVLLQDTKSSSVGGAFGGGSSSVFGATGAATLAQKLTRWTAVIFAITSVALSIFASRSHKSVFDSTPIPAAAAPANPAATSGGSTTGNQDSAATTQSPATQAPAASQAAPGTPADSTKK